MRSRGSGGDGEVDAGGVAVCAGTPLEAGAKEAPVQGLGGTVQAPSGSGLRKLVREINSKMSGLDRGRTSVDETKEQSGSVDQYWTRWQLEAEKLANWRHVGEASFF